MTKNMVVGESVYGEKRMSVEVRDELRTHTWTALNTQNVLSVDVCCSVIEIKRRTWLVLGRFISCSSWD